MTGIIAEYNPFHNGHAYQISEIRRLKPAEEIIAVMSGSFTQRGTPAILDKWTRAKLAVEGGVDLVLELPFLYAVRSAQEFARGAVNLLSKIEIDTLAFGAEISDVEKLKLAASTFADKNFAEKLKLEMSSGKPYAAAVTKILSDVTQLDEKFLKLPNTILAIEYLRALAEKNSAFGAEVSDVEKLKLEMSSGKPYAAAVSKILSNVAQIDEKFLKLPNTILAIEYLRALPKKISPLLIPRGKVISSATSIRRALFEKPVHWEKISVPPAVLEILKAAELPDEKFLFRPLVTKILTSDLAALKKIYGMNEGIEFKLIESARSAKNFSELVGGVVNRRFTISRVKRLLLHFLLDVTAEKISSVEDYARVLAFNERGRKLLKSFKNRLPIITKVAQHLNSKEILAGKIFEPYKKTLAFDLLATDLRATLFETPKNWRQDFNFLHSILN